MYLRNPVIRWGIGLASGSLIALIALAFLEGDLQLVALAIAVVDALTTPWILKQAA